MRILIILTALLALSACKQNVELPSLISPYRIDIQQGNVVTQEMVSKLKVGMTRAQVRFVLGSPLVTDMFHGDRWDYVYLMQRQGKADERRRLTVIFDGDKMATLEGDIVLTDKVEPSPAPRAPGTVTISTEPKPTPKEEAAKAAAAKAEAAKAEASKAAAAKAEAAEAAKAEAAQSSSGGRRRLKRKNAEAAKAQAQPRPKRKPPRPKQREQKQLKRRRPKPKRLKQQRQRLKRRRQKRRKHKPPRPKRKWPRPPDAAKAEADRAAATRPS